MFGIHNMMSTYVSFSFWACSCGRHSHRDGRRGTLAEIGDNARGHAAGIHNLQ